MPKSNVAVMASMVLLLGLSLFPVFCQAQTCSPCHQDATCMGATCVCNTGFTGDGTSCQDVDECTDMSHTCNEAVSVCMNTDGDFTCTCNAGYSNANGDGKTCQDDPPVFVMPCPGNISHVADPSSTSTSVAWTDPTAMDVVDGGSVDVTCDPLSGNQFLIGTHQVTCTATDSGGRSRTCSFAVIITDFNECTAPEGLFGRHDCVDAVCGNTHGGFICTCNAGYSKANVGDHICTDTERPVFTANTCPPSTSHIAQPSSTVTTVTWTEPTATDSTGVTPTVECAPASGTDFAIGQTPVTCTATDAAGNKASPDCTFTVTVTDFNECTAQEGSPGRHDCVNAVCGDIDGGFTCTCNTGYNKLNDDDHTCRDVTPPEFTATPCQSPVTQVADPNSMTSTSVTWMTPAATDSTGVPPTVTCTPSTNDAFRIGDTPVTCTARDAAGNRAENDCTFTVTVTDFDECSAETNGDDCDTNANCTNINGGFGCTCTAGYTGNGVTCTACSFGFFGLGCTSRCTCVQDAVCNNVNGQCTCTPVFPDAACDKTDLDVELSVTEDPVLDTAAVDNATLRCRVNLHSRDLDPMNPVTIRSPNGTSETAAMVTEGTYEVVIGDVSPDNSGTYTCTAATIINGASLSDSDGLDLDVLAPGRIISLDESKEGKLGETVTVDCVVYARPPPVITWFDNSNAVIGTGDSKYSVSSVDGEERLTSSLSVTNLIRVDNGTYACQTSNNLTQDVDRREAAVIVIEVPEVGGVDAEAISATEIEVTWEVTYDGNALPFMCKVDFKDSESREWTLGPFAEEPSLSRPVTNLIPYTGYDVRVTCQNRAGDGAEVTRQDVVTTLQAAPDAPENVRVTARTSISLTVAWNAPTVKRGTIAYYVVTVDSALDEPVSRQTPGPGNPAPRTLVLDQLSPYRNYTIYVTAFNVEGNNDLMGDDSDTITHRTAESTPSSPVNVLLDNEGSTCILTWDPPEEENGIILSYTIFLEAYKYPEPGTDVSDNLLQDSSKSSSVSWSEVEERSYGVNKTDLEPYAKFRFQVLAATEPGSGERSPETNVTCDSPPSAPTEVIATPKPVDFISEDIPVVTHETFWMAVSPASTTNGPISCYDIVVIQLPEGEGIDGKEPSVEYPIESFVSLGDAQKEPGKPYIARSLPGDMLTEITEFKIGDAGSSSCNPAARRRRRAATSTHKGDDGALKSDTTYTAFLLACVRRADGTELCSSSPLMEPITTMPGVNGPAIAIGIILALLIVVVVALVVIIYMKRRKQMPLLRDNENGVAMVPVVEKEPEVTHMVVLSTLLEDLSEKVRQKSANDDEIFKAEFKSIPEATGDVTRNATNLECNREKNRYINIGAYDHTRVRLSPIEDQEGSDYINACFVDGYEKPRKFIAAQGPREDTVLDFWRMIWEQNCSTVIMLTKCLENGREKCAEYWPEEDAIMYEDIIVTLDDVVTCADYVIRKFTMQKHIETGEEEEDEDAEPIIGETRTLMQFHFLGWPDFGIPQYPHSMLCFIKRIRHMAGSRIEPGNIVVHCSAGVGRTGTYILIDSMLDMMKKEKRVDIYNVIYKLRNQRNLLVQSLVQYIFIHKALTEEYLYGHTEVAVGSFHLYSRKLCAKNPDGDDIGVETEYRTVASLPVENTDQKTGNIEANKQKNRIRQVIPYDRNRVKLERLTGQEHSNYINASFINGYEHKKAYIAAQGPLSNTMGDFWRMAWENQCSTIVMLTDCEERGQNVCAKYWPESGETLNAAFLAVSVKESKEEEDCTIRDLEVSTTKGAGTKLIRQYHFHGWPEVGVPDSSASLVKVIGQAHEYQQDIGRFPILIHCSAGSGRTGVFVALSYLLQRAKAEGIVDIFQAVRALRQQRPHMVQDVAQYQFCYRAMMEYLDSFDHYANFK